MKARLAALLLAGVGLGALAQPQTQAPTQPAGCPQPADVAPADLLGLWRAEFDGQPQGATLLLERHPVYAHSLRGAINRNGERGLVAGDIEDGEVTLEESVDGRRIDGTWLGEVVPGSCGREIRGSWQPRGDGAPQAFTMRKL